MPNVLKHSRGGGGGGGARTGEPQKPRPRKVELLTGTRGVHVCECEAGAQQRLFWAGVLSRCS